MNKFLVRSIVVLLIIFSCFWFSIAIGEETVKLRFVYLGSAADIKIWKDLADMFHEKHPNIVVDVQAVPATTWAEYFDKIATMIAGGSPPDLARIAIEGVQLCATKGLMLPIDKYVSRDKEELQEFFDDVHPALIEVFRYEGKIYMLPIEWNNMVIFYNTKIFEKNGIARPSKDWTKEDFLEIARKLTQDFDGDDRIDQYGFEIPIQYFAGAMPWIFNAGATFLTPDWKKPLVNDPKCVDAVQFMRDLIWEHKVAPPAPTSLDPLYAHFSSGQIAMMGGGRWPVLQFVNAGMYDFDVQLWPKWRDQVTEFGVGGVAIMQATKNPDAAWEFVKFTTSKESMIYWTKLGWCVPARRSIAYSDAMYELPPKHAELYYDSLNNARAVPSPPQYNQVENIFLRYLGEVLANERDAREAMDLCQKELEAVMQ
ncbi:MAG: sugar ABC transporter substrate-binding protein [Candidatus Methanomethylicaceae archaeon]